MIQLETSDCLPAEFFRKLPLQFSVVCFHGGFTILSPKPARPQQLRRQFDCRRLVTTMFNLSSDWTHAPFRSLAFLLNVGIEITEYNCQSVLFSVSTLNVGDYIASLIGVLSWKTVQTFVAGGTEKEKETQKKRVC